MTNSYLQQLDEERKRRATTMQTLAIAENSNVELKKKLTVEEQALKVQTRPWKVQRDKLRTRGSWHVRPMTNWLLLRSNWQL